VVQNVQISQRGSYYFIIIIILERLKEFRKKNMFLLLYFSLKTQLRKWTIHDYVTIIRVHRWSMTRRHWELLRDYSTKSEEITSTVHYDYYTLSTFKFGISLSFIQKKIW